MGLVQRWEHCRLMAGDGCRFPREKPIPCPASKTGPHTLFLGPMLLAFRHRAVSLLSRAFSLSTR
jgi:hypothetical protein